MQGALGIRSDRDHYEPEHIPDLPDNVVAVGAGHYASYAATDEARRRELPGCMLWEGSMPESRV